MKEDTTYEIKTVSIIGLGALGILFGHQLSLRIPKDNLRIIADPQRIDKYRKELVYCNGKVCDFHYVSPEEPCEPADLIIFTVKYQGLSEAIKAVKHQVGEKTIILSALNGITSEGLIGEAYGTEKLLYCVAQGMDAVKEGNQLTYDHMGMLVVGEKESMTASPKVQAVASFFDHMEIPHKIDLNMNKRVWGKFMLNVGVNQTVAVVEGNYGDILKDGPTRKKMIAAMREVMSLSQLEGITLTEDDLNYWLKVLEALSPEGKPSMRQDMEAKRYSEVELFAGTVLKLGEKHGVDTPVNQELYQIITSRESQY